MKKVIHLLIAGLLFGVSCRTENTESDIPEIQGLDNVIVIDSETTKYELAIERDFTLSPENDLTIGSISSVVANGNNHFYLADPQRRQIHEYDDSGTYVRSYGRAGQGPGEFTGLSDISVYGEFLFCFDTSQFTVHTYNVETGELVSTLNIGNVWEDASIETIRPFLSKIIPKSENTFYITTQNRVIEQRADTVKWLQFSFSESRGGDIYLTYPTGDYMYGSGGNGRRFATANQLTAKSKMLRTFDGGLVYGHGGTGLFKFFNSDNEYQSSVYLDLPRLSIQEAILDSLGNASNRMSPAMSIDDEYDWVPEEWPVWHDFQVSTDGNLWIQVNTNPPDEREWWVVSPVGELLAKNPLFPVAATPAITGSNIYHTMYNDSLGGTELFRHTYTFE